MYVFYIYLEVSCLWNETILKILFDEYIYICVCIYIYIYLIVKITSLVTVFKTKLYFNIIHSFDLIFEMQLKGAK